MTALMILAAAAAAAGLYYLIRRMLTRKEENSVNFKPKPQQDSEKAKYEGLLQQLLRDIREGAVDGTGDGTSRLPKKYDPVADHWEKIRTIVNGLRFFERKISVVRKVGEEVIDTDIPTGDIEINGMRSLSEIPRALTGQLASDDDMFYANVATRQILVKRPIEYVGVYKERFLKQRKTLRVLQDVSGSTKGDRIAWSRILLTLLAEKAKKGRADYFLTTFADGPIASVNADPFDQNSLNIALNFIEREIRADGGTNINTALILELDKIEQENKELNMQQSAQIVLVTDGTEGIDAKLITGRMKELGVALHTVVLGVSHDQLRSISQEFYFLGIAQDPSV